MDPRRVALFLIGCIGTRLALVWCAYRYPQMLRPMAFMATAIAIGFMYIWANGLRKTGVETFGERIWWDDLRPVHSLLWALFAALAFYGEQNLAWKVLLLDVTIGFSAFSLRALR